MAVATDATNATQASRGKLLFSPFSLDDHLCKGTHCLERHYRQQSGVIPSRGVTCWQLGCWHVQLCQFEAVGQWVQWCRGVKQSELHALGLPGHVDVLPSASARLPSQQITMVVRVPPPPWQLQCQRHSMEQSRPSTTGMKSFASCCFQHCLCGCIIALPRRSSKGGSS